MTERQAVEAIYLRWTTIWPTLQALVAYCFENEIVATSSSWVRVAVSHTVSIQRSQGQPPYRKFERRGNVFVQAFAPIDGGRGPLSDLLDSARTVLEGVNVGTGSDVVNLYAGTTREVPADGAWSMAVLAVPFRYVETR